LSKGMRIPCYKGTEPVRLTYHGFVRQIRGVLRVAKLQSLSAGGNVRSSQPTRYRYFATEPIAQFLEEFEVGWRTMTSVTARVGA
jgi:hypothetical protein